MGKTKIVRTQTEPWLTPNILSAALRPAELATLERLVLEGEATSPDKVPRELRAKLSAEELAFINEKSLQVKGNPGELLRSAQELSAPKSAERESDLAWERYFLKGFALSRIGNTADAKIIFSQLPSRFASRIETELGLERLNKGEMKQAQALFERVLARQETGADPFSVCTLLGGYCLALIHQGHFEAAKRAIHKRQRVLRDSPSSPLLAGTRLYEALLLLERNEYDKAYDLISTSLEAEGQDSINRFFLQNLRLRLFLGRNLLEEATEALMALAATAKKMNLPEGVLDFRLEEIELHLRKKNAKEAQAKARALTEAARANKDEFLLFRLGLLSAQVSLQTGNASQALEEVQNVIAAGETQNYRPFLCWAFFHAAGIARAADNSILMKIYLNRGRQLAFQLGLRAKAACFDYMKEVLENKYASASALISLAKHQEIGQELEYFLENYDLLQSVSVGVHDGRKTELVNEHRLRRMFFGARGAFWFQKESILLVNKGERQVASVDFPKGSPLLVAFRLLWSELLMERKGLKLVDFHRARSKHKFVEELHASSAKMLVSRLRDRLKGSTLEVVYDRDSGYYGLRTMLPPYTLQSSVNEGSYEKRSTREEEILSRIALDAFVPTATLCEEFGVSRQALHPHLQELLRDGKIRLVRRGPRSGYIKT